MAYLDNLNNVKVLELDVVSTSTIEAEVEFVRKDSETLDILVNNAGQSMVCPALNTSIDDAKTLFDVNLWGVITATQAFAPLVISAKGTIVNVCSISGFLYAPWMGPYNASKAALMSWSEALRPELQPFDVKVLSLATGSVAANVLSLDNIHLPVNSPYEKSIHQIQKRDVGEDIQGKSSPGRLLQRQWRTMS